jgi:hypothetical protein
MTPLRTATAETQLPEGLRAHEWLKDASTNDPVLGCRWSPAYIETGSATAFPGVNIYALPPRTHAINPDLMLSGATVLFITHTATTALPSINRADSTKKQLLISDLEWSPDQILEARMRLRAFEDDWGAPGMEAYDAL